MIPVVCNCANNKNGTCYGNCNTGDIKAVMANEPGIGRLPYQTDSEVKEFTATADQAEFSMDNDVYSVTSATVNGGTVAADSITFSAKKVIFSDLTIERITDTDTEVLGEGKGTDVIVEGSANSITVINNIKSIQAVKVDGTAINPSEYTFTVGQKVIDITKAFVAGDAGKLITVDYTWVDAVVSTDNSINKDDTVIITTVYEKLNVDGNKIKDGQGLKGPAGCPGYIVITSDAFPGVPQGDRKFGPEGQTQL